MFVPSLLLAFLALTQGPAPAAPAPAVAAPAAQESDWVAAREDNICGLSDLRAVSAPGKVDYPRLWKATPEIKKLEDEGIDPESAEGISLQQEATDRIREACDEVREDEALCSVWKAIRHRDGQAVPDITRQVEKLFPDALDD